MKAICPFLLLLLLVNTQANGADEPQQVPLWGRFQASFTLPE